VESDILSYSAPSRPGETIPKPEDFRLTTGETIHKPEDCGFRSGKMKHFYNAGDREYGLSVFTTASNSRKTGEFAIFESEADWPVEKGDCRTGASDILSDSGHFLPGEMDGADDEIDRAVPEADSGVGGINRWARSSPGSASGLRRPTWCDGTFDPPRDVPKRCRASLATAVQRAAGGNS
jgi:hypothetical protein